MKALFYHLVAFCIVVMLFISAAWGQVNSKSYDFMLKKLLSQTVPYISCDSLVSNNNVILLDTRETAEYEVSHIKNSLHLGYDNIDSSMIEGLNKADTIVVYCSVGYRSEKVGEWLINQGFENVFNLHGGIFEWKNQDNMVVDSTSNTTENVHAFNKKWGFWLKKGQKIY